MLLQSENYYFSSSIFLSFFFSVGPLQSVMVIVRAVKLEHVRRHKNTNFQVVPHVYMGARERKILRRGWVENKEATMGTRGWLFGYKNARHFKFVNVYSAEICLFRYTIFYHFIFTFHYLRYIKNHV